MDGRMDGMMDGDVFFPFWMDEFINGSTSYEKLVSVSQVPVHTGLPVLLDDFIFLLLDG